MLKVIYSNQFKKDFKKCQKRGLEIKKLKLVVSTLTVPENLPEKNREHYLSGNYRSYKECHIEPDWLLIYKQTEDSLELVRTGTHSDLFKK